MTIMRIRSDFISIAKNNTTYTNNSTREILDNFGNILINIVKKVKIGEFNYLIDIQLY
jgi:hypothetical protein